MVTHAPRAWKQRYCLSQMQISFKKFLNRVSNACTLTLTHKYYLFESKYTHVHKYYLSKRPVSFWALLNKVPKGVWLLLTRAHSYCFFKVQVSFKMLLRSNIVLASWLHHLKVEKNPLQMQLLIKVCHVVRRASSIKSKHEISIMSCTYLKLIVKTFSTVLMLRQTQNFYHLDKGVRSKWVLLPRASGLWMGPIMYRLVNLAGKVKTFIRPIQHNLTLFCLQVKL